MSNPNWDDVPDVHLDGRTIIPCPDPAPEFTAAAWRRWHDDREARLAKERAKIDEEAEVYKGWEAPIITQAAQEFDDPCRSLASYVKLAVANSWRLVELSHALSTAKGRAFETGAKAGQIRPDREVELQWVKLEKPDVKKRAIIAYTIINGKTDGPSVLRRINGVRYSDAEMKRELKDA